MAKPQEDAAGLEWPKVPFQNTALILNSLLQQLSPVIQKAAVASSSYAQVLRTCSWDPEKSRLGTVTFCVLPLGGVDLDLRGVLLHLQSKDGQYQRWARFDLERRMAVFREVPVDPGRRYSATASTIADIARAVAAVAVTLQRAAPPVRLAMRAATPSGLHLLAPTTCEPLYVDIFVLSEHVAAPEAPRLARPSAEAAEISVAELMAMLSDMRQEPQVRRDAALALGEMAPHSATPEVIRALVERLGDPDEYVRQAAARALGEMAPQSASDEVVEALAERLKDEQWQVREAATEALRRLLPEPQLVERLLEVLQVRGATEPIASILSGLATPQQPRTGAERQLVVVRLETRNPEAIGQWMRISLYEASRLLAVAVCSVKEDYWASSVHGNEQVLIVPIGATDIEVKVEQLDKSSLTEDELGLLLGENG
ncbi:MAG: HEAT repeat domain-containing protein, partial [Armatimonadetes bacterium]|nr:HEAT repeat domain-containing protein [Armatimonadota bacterium]